MGRSDGAQEFYPAYQLVDWMLYHPFVQDEMRRQMAQTGETPEAVVKRFWRSMMSQYYQLPDEDDDEEDAAKEDEKA